MTLTDTEAIKAYLKLIRYGKPITVREFQRLMGYNSPGKAQRILERLVREGLAIRNNNGSYEPVREAASQLNLIIIRRFIIPRRLALTSSISALSITYAILANIDPITRMVLIIIGLLCLLDSYEIINTHRSLTK